ncbi:MAG: folate-binding protein YgfZ [Rhizobiaceae bacterium]
MTFIAPLQSRALLELSGGEVVSFLQNLVTCDVEGLKANEATFGALLTPQGKILFDFFLLRNEDGFLLDVDSEVRDDLAKRLMFYKLRADVSIKNSDKLVSASWAGENQNGFIDPRSSLLGTRIYSANQTTTATEEDWQTMRIAVGMPHSGLDFELGSTFPHEVLMDQFGGVDFTKGCYVGQEVVSRMHHRGTTRSRVVCVEGTGGSLPIAGTELLADDRTIGTMGSASHNKGLATVRLDRLKTATEAGTEITVSGMALIFSRPQFANYEWPL